MSVKFVVFGSCLSGQIALRLREKGHTYLGPLYHIRSDVLFDALQGKSGLSLSGDHAEELIADAEKKNEKLAKRIRNKVKQNSKHSLDVFISRIKRADFIVFDNQYDLDKGKFSVKIGDSEHVLSNLNVEMLNRPVKKFGLIPDDSLGDYDGLYSAIKNINKNAEIVFVQYPIVNGEDAASTGRGRRIERSKMTAARRKDWQFLSTPLYKIDIDHTVEGSINHFRDYVYDEIAGIVEKIMLDRESVCSPDITGLGGFFSQISSPYAEMPDRQYWKVAVADPYPLSIKNLYRKKIEISASDAVATCGSCFAQHIGKQLVRKGLNYLDSEPAPDGVPAEEAKALGYGIYSARYGNVYTSRQLLQLFDRAFGTRLFDEVWQNKDGRFVDPFRPNLCGGGYASADEVLQEQQRHLQNVRRMFETLDVFVFTMGLTETWANRDTGAVYPICPGVTAGTFDPERTEFLNLDYATILEEMEAFLDRLRKVNPAVKVLLTVSPVPLTATAEDRHVLVSTMASKAILRAVADQLYRRHDNVDYFPSYDIIMSPPYKSMFFKSNLRTIHEEGVDYVMSHFFAEHRFEDVPGPQAAGVQEASAAPVLAEDDDDEAFCDEAFLELERSGGR